MMTPEKTPPQIETLRSNLASLIEESQALRTDVKSAAVARRRENLVNLMLSVIGVLVIAALLVVVYQGRKTSEQTARTSEQIASCTTPEGKCYQDSNKRTSGTVQKLITYNMFIYECGRTVQTDAGLEKCVNDKIAAAEAKQK